MTLFEILMKYAYKSEFLFHNLYIPGVRFCIDGAVQVDDVEVGTV
ncbi:hypothetical protein SAMN04487930_1282, partial [Cytophaga hutchinsonii ATCC 33406]